MKQAIFYLIIGIIVESVLVYIFEISLIPLLILNAIIGFIINNGVPMRDDDKYPFFRLGVIILFLYIGQDLLILYTKDFLTDFFVPNLTWKILLIISFLSGVIYYFGKLGNGYQSEKIQTVGAVITWSLYIIAFILFWWEGGLFFLLIRWFFQMIEEVIAGIILLLLKNAHEKKHYQNLNP